MTTLRQPIGDAVLHLQSKVDNPDLTLFNQWCNAHHAEFLEHVSGALSMRRFEVVQTKFSSPAPTFPLLTVYQLKDETALDGPEYEMHSATQTPMPPEAGPVTGYIRTIFRQVAPAGGGSQLADGVEPLADGQPIGSALMQVFGEVDAEWEDEVNAWYDQDHMPAVATAPGVLSARRFIDRDAPATPGTTQSPQHFRYVALYELEDASVLDDPAFAAAGAPTEWRQKIGQHFRSQLQVYRQVFPESGPLTRA